MVCPHFVSEFVSKSVFTGRPYKTPVSIPRQVRPIPLLENPEELFIAGEDLDQIWPTFCRGKGDLRMDSWTVPDGVETECSA
jgi:hypothetical protein